MHSLLCICIGSIGITFNLSAHIYIKMCLRFLWHKEHTQLCWKLCSVENICFLFCFTVYNHANSYFKHGGYSHFGPSTSTLVSIQYQIITLIFFRFEFSFYLEFREKLSQSKKGEFQHKPKEKEENKNIGEIDHIIKRKLEGWMRRERLEKYSNSK